MDKGAETEQTTDPDSLSYSEGKKMGGLNWAVLSQKNTLRTLHPLPSCITSNGLWSQSLGKHHGYKAPSVFE